MNEKRESNFKVGDKICIFRSYNTSGKWSGKIAGIIRVKLGDNNLTTYLGIIIIIKHFKLITLVLTRMSIGRVIKISCLCHNWTLRVSKRILGMLLVWFPVIILLRNTFLQS